MRVTVKPAKCMCGVRVTACWKQLRWKEPGVYQEQKEDQRGWNRQVKEKVAQVEGHVRELSIYSKENLF